LSALAQRAALATLSTLSFLFIAKLRTSPFEVAMISSARQLAAERFDLKADLWAPVVMNIRAISTLL